MFGLANHDAGLVGEFDVSLLSSTHDVPWHSAEKPFEEADCEKEPEMQIGMPTDVKHVAHIGWDGPASASPSWMNEFPASTESSSEPLNQAMGNPAVISKAKAKTQKPSEEPLDSPTRRNSTKTKQSRRNITSSNGLVDSPGRDSSKPRRPKTSSNLGSDTPSQEPSGIGPSKKSNRKKSKGSGGGSTKSARSNAPEQMGENFPFSDPGTGYGSKNDGLKSILEGHDEGKECDEISRGFRAL